MPVIFFLKAARHSDGMSKIASVRLSVCLGLSLWTALLTVAVPVAEANFTSFGNSGTHTSVSPDAGGDNRTQGTMPGSILTPMVRLDLDATFVDSPPIEVQPPDPEEEAKGGDKGPVSEDPITVDFPNDDAVELMQLRLRFTNTRVKDVGAIAIAREGGDNFASVGAPLATLYNADGTPNSPVDPDALGARLGASRDGNERAGVYTPDEDNIIAYVSVANLLSSTTFPLDAYSRNWTLTITFTDDGFEDDTEEGCTDVPPFAANTNRNFYVFTDLEDPANSVDLFADGALTPIRFRSANVVRTDETDGTRFGTFYVLASSSRAIESGDSINVSIDVPPGLEPPATIGGFDQTLAYDPSLEDPNNPDVSNEGQSRFVYYDYANGGLLVRVAQPAVIDDPDNDDDTQIVTTPVEDTYIEGPAFPENMSGAVICMDLVADQVPARKVNDTLVDIEGGRELGSPNFGGGFFTAAFENRLWSQFPPGYPPVSIASRNPTDPTDFDVVSGRVHPDANIFTSTYPSPEVIASGGHIYNWFGFDFAGGWIGGYDWRFSGVKVEVQGLGFLDEIPRDGIDNDLDGLTDEVGTEDIPQDRQLPNRNDDVDFFADLRSSIVEPDPETDITSAVDGSPLTAEEQILLNAIRIQLNTNVETAQYDVQWDPVFQIRHLFDEDQRRVITNPMGETSFSYASYELPDKFYRDLVIPGFVDSELLGGGSNPGLTQRYQPELAILFSPTSATNPPTLRDQYYANLLRLGAIQSRRIDEDGDGEDNSPLVMGLFKFADGIDNDGDGLIDEGIDEETENGLDDDGDGLTDEDVNFVPLYLNIDEEINNFFVDGPGGRANAFDPNVDFTYIDYNNNGVYDDGRNDQVTPNLDEFQGPGNFSPMQEGDPYSVPIAFPIDDDLDGEGEDGNPLTPRPPFDGIDNNNNGLADEGFNEDIRDLVFDDFALPFIGSTGVITDSWLYEDLNGNARLDPGTFQNPAGGGDSLVQPFDDNVAIPFISPNLFENDTDRYTLQYLFPGSDGSNGPNVPIHLDGQYDFFLGFQIQENMSPGADFAVTIRPDSVRMGFDTRPNFNPGTFTYPTTGDFLQMCRFRALRSLNPEYIGATAITQPAQSTAYQITKRQIAHLDVSDGLGFQSPIEVDGGYRGRPYLDNLCNPFPVLAVNMTDAGPGSVSEQNTILDSIRVNFDPIPLDGDGLWDPTTNAGDLRPLSNNIIAAFDQTANTTRQIVDSGVAIYLDNKTLGERGAFDTSDTPLLVNLESLSWNPDPSDPVARSGGYYVVLKPQAGVAIADSDFFEIPNVTLDNLDPNRGYDLFICVRTNTYSRARNTFRAYIRPGDISYTNGRNTIGSGVVSHSYTNNVPIIVETFPNQSVIPRSDSTAVLGLNMLDENNTFAGTPARWSLLSLRLDNVDSADRSFTPSDLLPISNGILRNIPLDPAEDNDGDARTFAIPDGIDNDNDGLIDEGLNNSLDFDPSRYTSLSGVAIFRDMPNSDRNGVFDDPLSPTVVNPDLPVYMSGEENFSFPIGTEAYLQIALDHDPVSPNAPGKGDPVDPDPFELIPINDVAKNRGNDYFVVVRTSKTITQGDDFRVRLGTHTTLIHNGNGVVSIVVGTTTGFMPGATTGLGPVFPNRQPYTFDPLINARLVPSLTRQVEEPLSPGFVRIPGMAAYDPDAEAFSINASHPFASPIAIEFAGMDYANEVFDLEDPFDLYETYDHAFSGVVSNTEDGSDVPFLEFLQPRFNVVIEPDPEFDAGTVFLRWIDSDEDNPQALVTVVYWPMVMDPIFGELFPQTPEDARFDINVVSGIRGALELGSDIDDFTIFDYEDQFLSDDNENIDPNTDSGTDTFTWDARLVTPGNYRIGAIVDDQINPPIIVAGGKIQITNERPIVILTEP